MVISKDTQISQPLGPARRVVHRPSDGRVWGRDETIRFAVCQSTLGLLLAAFSEKGVVAILMGEDEDALIHDLQRRFPRASLVGDERECEALLSRVALFVEAPLRGLDLPLDVRGSAFQQRVWKELQVIPGGELASYSDIAKRLHMPDATRAVAAACAANNIAVAIPCHRVVLSDGRYGNYAWGVKRKQNLIERELERV